MRMSSGILRWKRTKLASILAVCEYFLSSPIPKILYFGFFNWALGWQITCRVFVGKCCILRANELVHAIITDLLVHAILSKNPRSDYAVSATYCPARTAVKLCALNAFWTRGRVATGGGVDRFWRLLRSARMRRIHFDSWLTSLPRESWKLSFKLAARSPSIESKLLVRSSDFSTLGMFLPQLWNAPNAALNNAPL